MQTNVIEWALRKQQIPEALIRRVMCLYTNSKTKVPVAGGTYEFFHIKRRSTPRVDSEPSLVCAGIEGGFEDGQRGGV